MVTGLRALVTGASSGIGAAVAQELARRGARVAGTGRDATTLAAVAGAAPLELTMVRDLVVPGAAAEVVEEAAQVLGGLDLVISNAGAGWVGPLETTSPEVVDQMIDLNLRAPMHLARAAASHLLASPARGQLVLVGSISGLVGVPEEVPYGAAKAGVKGLADGLRAEWGGAVTVSLVSPGPVATAFFDRRNQPYMRSWPKPLPVAKVSQVILDAIERRREDVVVPAWLALPARLNGGAPALYRRLQKLQGIARR